MTFLNFSNLQVIDGMQQIFKFLYFSQGLLLRICFKQCYDTSKPNKLTGYRWYAADFQIFLLKIYFAFDIEYQWTIDSRYV